MQSSALGSVALQTPDHGEHGSLRDLGLGIRVLTTSGRKPPLRTNKFLGFRGEWLPRRASDAGVKVHKIRLLPTYLSPKPPHGLNLAFPALPIIVDANCSAAPQRNGPSAEKPPDYGLTTS